MNPINEAQLNGEIKGTSRRNLLKAASAIGVLAAAGLPVSSLYASNMPSVLSLKMAGYDYDRVQAIIDGRVKIDGCDISFDKSSVGEMNTHVFDGPQTRIVSEIGLQPFMLAYEDGHRDYTLLPIFPLRTFRHKNIFIRNDRDIEKPEDLRGKKVASPGYSSTSLTWIRGILQDEYNVSPTDIKWVISAKDSAAKDSGPPSKQENIFPEGLSIIDGPEDQDESDLLESGQVDALFHAAEPRGFIQGHPKITRLFSDSRATERAYYEKTGIFPIMHAVAFRKDMIEKHPWLVEAVFNAYSEAKQFTYEYLVKSAWLMTTLPWVAQETEETRKLMGDNYWSYGIEGNREDLDTLFRYSYEQGINKSRLTIEELFHPSGLKLAESLK